MLTFASTAIKVYIHTSTKLNKQHKAQNENDKHTHTLIITL